MNVVEGLKLYENLFDSTEISKLFFLANELRAAGRRGEFPGMTSLFALFFFVSNVHSRPLIGVIFMNLRILLSVHCLYKTNKLLKDYGGSFVLIRISLFGHGHFSNDVM